MVFYNSLATIRCFVLNISVVSKCLLIRHLPRSVGVCSSTSLSHGATFPRSTPIPSDGGFGNVFRWLNRIVHWCVAVTEPDIWNFIASTLMTHNSIHRVFALGVSEFFCSSMSSIFVYSVALLVKWVIWLVYKLLLCGFRRWRQCTLVSWVGISNAIFIHRDCRRGYFDYLKPSCLKGHQLVVRLRRQKCNGRCCHWWAIKVEVLSYSKRKWCTANLLIMITLVSSFRRFHSLSRVLAHYGDVGQ